MTKLNPIQFNEHVEVHPDKGMAILGGHAYPAVSARWFDEHSVSAHVVTPLENGHLAHIEVRTDEYANHLSEISGEPVHRIKVRLRETRPNGSQVVSRGWHGNDFDKLHTQVRKWAETPGPAPDTLKANQRELAARVKDKDVRYGPVGDQWSSDRGLS